MSQAVCPSLGTDQKNLITQANMDSLTLSSYERVQDTVVQVSCYLPSLYQLDGPTRVKCSKNGEWIPSTPKCVRRTSSSTGVDTNVVTNGTRPEVLSTQETVVSTTTVLLIVTSFIAVVLLAVVFLLIYKLSCERNRKWETLKETSEDETYRQKARKSIVSPVSPTSYIHRQSFESNRKLSSAAPSWHSHPIITSNQPFSARSWTELSVDKFLRDIDKSRRENPNHTWRDFATISTRLSTSTI